MSFGGGAGGHWGSLEDNGNGGISQLNPGENISISAPTAAGVVTITGVLPGWPQKQYAHARSILGSKIDDFVTAEDFISPGGYTLNGMARINKGKGRVTSAGAGNAYGTIGLGITASIIDNPLTESWYAACHGGVMLAPSVASFIYAIFVNGVASGLDGIILNGSVSQTKFKIMTDNGAPVHTDFAASVGAEIQLGVDYDFALAFDHQAQVLTAYLDQGLQATQGNVSQIAPTIANISTFQLGQTGVFEVDDLFFAFKRNP